MIIPWLAHPDPASTRVPVIGDPREALAFRSSLVWPISNYIYDPMLGFWVPQTAGPGGTVIEYNSARIAGMLSAIIDALELNEYTKSRIVGELTKLVANVGEPVVEQDAARIAAFLSSINQIVEENGSSTDAVRAELTKLVDGIGLQDRTAAMLMASVLGFRKTVGIDGGAITPTLVADTDTVYYTGLALDGRVLFLYNEDDAKIHWITAVTDPAGANPGTLTVSPNIQTIGATLLVPYKDVPHGYETLADGIRVKRLDPEWAHYTDPNQVMDVAENPQPLTASVYFNGIDYENLTIEVEWACGQADASWQIDIFGRLNDTAAATYVNLNGSFRLDGAPALGAAAQTGHFVIHLLEDFKIREWGITRTGGAGAVGDDNTLGAWVTLHV